MAADISTVVELTYYAYSYCEGPLADAQNAVVFKMYTFTEQNKKITR